VTERETSRLIAWADELRRVHTRLRAAVNNACDALEGEPDAAVHDLLLYCRGFCVALDEHHRGEDRALFPAIEAEHPELAPVLRSLEQDHSMIVHLLGALRNAVDRGAGPDELERHLDGVGAIMESHFRYEERRLSSVLQSLALDSAPTDVLGRL